MWSRECDEIKQIEMSHDLEKRRIEVLAFSCEENKHMLSSASSSLAISEKDEQEVNDKAHQPKINHTMLHQQGSDARLAKLHPQVTESVLSSYLDDQSLSRLSTNCVTLYAQ